MLLLFLFFRPALFAAGRKFFINLVFDLEICRVVAHFGIRFFYLVDAGFGIVKFYLNHFQVFVPVGTLHNVHLTGDFFNAFFTHAAVAFHFMLFWFLSGKYRECSHNEHGD
jgi:hypothetical protein